MPRYIIATVIQRNKYYINIDVRMYRYENEEKKWQEYDMKMKCESN